MERGNEMRNQEKALFRCFSASKKIDLTIEENMFASLELYYRAKKSVIFNLTHGLLFLHENCENLTRD